MIEKGEVQGGISEHLTQADRDKGYRLACKAGVSQDVVIRIPVESAVDISALMRKTPRRTAVIQQMDLEDIKHQGLLCAPYGETLLGAASAGCGRQSARYQPPGQLPAHSAQ